VEKNYALCLDVLRSFERAGVLHDVILVGSWCLPFYRVYFPGTGYHPTIRTRDIDFLVPQPNRKAKKVDIAALLKDKGFVESFSNSGFIQFMHPELIVEFLVSETGRGSDKPVAVPRLGINAQLHFTLKTNSLQRSDLDEFVACYFGLNGSKTNPPSVPPLAKGGGLLDRHQRKATWKPSPSHPALAHTLVNAGRRPQPHEDSPSPLLPLPSRERIRGEGASSSGEEGKNEGRWRSYNYDELVSRDKASLDILWLKDDSLEASDNLPDPDVIALEIVEDLEAALEQFREIVGDLSDKKS
jgi:hypothetical protein